MPVTFLGPEVQSHPHTAGGSADAEGMGFRLRIYWNGFSCRVLMFLAPS